jgi:glycosyltransferase involved in cell wall biosynthesis
MAARKACAASAVGGNRVLIRHGGSGFLAKPGNSDGLARILLASTNNPILQERLGNNAEPFIADSRMNAQSMNSTYYKKYSETIITESTSID